MIVGAEPCSTLKVTLNSISPPPLPITEPIAEFWPTAALLGSPVKLIVVGVEEAVPVVGLTVSHAATVVEMVKVSPLIVEVRAAVAV